MFKLCVSLAAMIRSDEYSSSHNHGWVEIGFLEDEFSLQRGHHFPLPWWLDKIIMITVMTLVNTQQLRKLRDNLHTQTGTNTHTLMTQQQRSPWEETTTTAYFKSQLFFVQLQPFFIRSFLNKYELVRKQKGYAHHKHILLIISWYTSIGESMFHVHPYFGEDSHEILQSSHHFRPTLPKD